MAGCGVKRFANTWVEEEDGEVKVTLHKTVVFTARKVNGLMEYVASMGGWNTPTTRRRINQCFEEFATPTVRVYQSKGSPYVVTRFGDRPFDNMFIVDESGFCVTDIDWHWPVITRRFEKT